jgi:hypothetical protein
MPIFAPAYYQSRNQRSYLARQQHLESKKRKREDDFSDDDDVEDDQNTAYLDPSQTQLSLSFQPVSKIDPYYVASHSREEALPLPPFPHAPVKEPIREKVPIEEELAALNPPLYVPPFRADDKNTSLKRRHLDNVTTILHQCMLKGDWTRAARAWSLLLRTEIAGRGIDVRRNGRWGVGAEILMKGAAKQSYHVSREVQDDSDSSRPQFSDEGFRLAREYYERLILQYPHTPYTQHNLNATAIYPALFSIWIYEVQDRSKRAKKQLNVADPDSSESSGISIRSDDSTSEKRRELHHIRNREFEGAMPIASRMDELLLSPPYDTSSTLVQLRGMVAMWISDLHAELVQSAENSGDGGSDRSSMEGADTSRHETQSRASLQKAKDIFKRLKAMGRQLPQQALDVLAEDGD